MEIAPEISWSGKPISKERLIACIKKDPNAVTNPSAMIAAIRARQFGGVLIGIDWGNGGGIVAQVTDNPVTETYNTYCGDAVRAAIIAVLGEEMEQFPFIHFHSSVRLN